MFELIFKIIKRIILTALLIYSFDIFGVSLGISIPINAITLILVSFFDFSALICLFLFSLTF